MRRIGVIGLLAVCLVLTSCRADKEKEEKTMAMETTEERLVTKEELFEKTGIVPDDFEGYDVDDFIQTMKITEKDLNARKIRVFWEVYTDESSDIYCEEEYAYLLETSLTPLEKEIPEDIKTVYIISQYDGCGGYYLFDFSNNRVCEGWRLKYIRETDADDKEQLLNLLKSAGLEQLEKTEYKGRRSGEWSNNFEIVIEMEDGKTAHYRADEEIPEAMEKLRGKNNENLVAIVEGDN